MLGDEKLVRDLSADQMLLDDVFEHIGRAGMVPRAFGVNHRDGTLKADLKAVGFRSVDATCSNQIQLDEALLEVLPRCQSFFL